MESFGKRCILFLILLFLTFVSEAHAEKISDDVAVRKMAAMAWEQSARTNYTKGADHFENIRRFGKPWWVKYCVKTYEYKDHVFYKEVRRRT